MVFFYEKECSTLPPMSTGDTHLREYISPEGMIPLRTVVVEHTPSETPLPPLHTSVWDDVEAATKGLLRRMMD